MLSKELKRGFHIAQDNSGITPTEMGIFIPYNGVMGDYMQDVQDFLKKYYPDAETRFPVAFARRHTLEEFEAAIHQIHEQSEEGTTGQERV